MNWGNRLLLTFLVFAMGMGLLVYRSLSTHYELVEKDYYKQELRYQDIIEGKKQANLSASKLEIAYLDDKLIITISNQLNIKEMKGTIVFYCPANSKNDRSFPLQLNEQGQQLIEASYLPKGNYVVKINWNLKGLNYFLEKEMYLSR